MRVVSFSLFIILTNCFALPTLEELYNSSTINITQNDENETLELLIKKKDALSSKVNDDMFKTTVKFNQEIESERSHLEQRIILLIDEEIEKNGAGEAILYENTKDKKYYQADNGLMELTLKWNSYLGTLINISDLSKTVTFKIEAKEARRIFELKRRHKFFLDISYIDHKIKLGDIYLQYKNKKYILNKTIGLNANSVTNFKKSKQKFFNKGFKRIVRGEREYKTIKDKPYLRDNLRGLLWGFDDNIKRTFKEAEQYCGKLSIDDFHNWRLPRMEELYYFVDRQQSGKKEDLKDWYWSSTKKRGSDTYWIVNLSRGYDSYLNKSGKYFTICVKEINE
jgi:hypothetical protein